MIEAVLLDFGGVVFRNKEEYEGPKGLLDMDPVLMTRARVGEIDDKQVFKDTASRYAVSEETVKKWLLSRREPNWELLELLTRLKPGIKKAIVNNGLRSLFHGLLDKYDLKDKFDLLVNSAEEKVEKPDPEIYLRTCQKLGVGPKQCLFVDDNEKFIQAALALGMETVFFTNIGDLQEKVKSLGLMITAGVDR